MAGEDRVVTTEYLMQKNNDCEASELQIGFGVLNDLDPDGLHVLVPRGQVHGPGDPRLVCEAQLALKGDAGSTAVEVLVAVDTFEELPPSFDVLRAASALVPATVTSVNAQIADAGAADDEGAS